VPVDVSRELIERITSELPELPAQRAVRLESEYALAGDAARTLAFRTDLGDYYEATVAAAPDGADPVAIANWTINELVARVGEDDPAASKVTPAALGELVAMVGAGEVNQGAARLVLDRLVADGGAPRDIVAAENLGAVGAGDELRAIVQAALDDDPEITARLRDGDMKPIGVVIGHVMRETKGRADGGEITRLIRERLGV
jgi:aspartyl-tRNA(Asn)/glutamyl-tRNA(Gln) amidotransferase subunit B